MTDCNHGPRHISGSWGEAWLALSGSWYTVRASQAGGREAVALEACPGCGVKLWGLPA